jgi:signal transduction histidine kinase
MNHSRLAHRPFSWSSIAAIVVEAVAACGFVIAVYELVVAGGIALWPGADDNWILMFWIAAAAIAGSGMTAVRSRARSLVQRVLPSSRPYPTLMSSVSGVVAAGAIEDAPSRLAQLLAEGTGATGAVWLARRSGLRRAGTWPAGDEEGQRETVASEAELLGLAGVDHVAPVRDAGKVLGALTLRAKPGRFLTPPDLRLAADVANAAGLLLRNAELAEQLREQVRVETAQRAELAASRRRVVVARDAAREQLSAEIQARVCAPLERGASRVEEARRSLRQTVAGRRLAVELAEMTGEMDTAIADFRRIVHGVYPPVLTDHGLLAAMENLLTEIDPQASLVTHRIPRIGARVEAGVYFCAAALLREWDITGAQRPMQVVAGVTSSLIQMTFVDGVPQTAMRPAVPVGPLVAETVRDRVAALGGRLQVDSDASGRWLVIEVPLEQADLTAPRNAKAAR